ncbi:MAG: NAD(P)H-hydrate dehydratase [Chryseolinea sp.]
MLKILIAKQIKVLDAYTIERDAISSIDLMERACRAFVNWFVANFDERIRVGIVCGPGNNGGDGLGIARLLKEKSFPVTVWIVKGQGDTTADFEQNLQRAQRTKVKIFEILHDDPETRPFEQTDVLIDAIFGSGLSRPVEGIFKWVIDEMNAATAQRVAVDIPTGLMADQTSTGSVFQANYTVSFQLPKLSFFLPGSYKYVGEWTLVEIGLHKDFISRAETHYHYITLKGCRKILKRRSRFDHKGTYGHALLIAGSLGKMGAAVLSAKASIRSGLGLLTVHVPRCGNVILQTAVPEAMASLDRSEEILTSPPTVDRYSTIGIGPGLGKASDTVKAMKSILQHFRKPMVIDADALNILAENPELLPLLPEGTILTPHPKEFERLVGTWGDDFQRLEKLREMSHKLNCVIVLKGAFTSIAEPGGNVYFNATGNPGMATAGTGDVLTGILTGLLAQQYNSLDAALLGTFLHGLSGDLAAVKKGMNSLIATDIINFLPAAYLKIRRE